MFEDESCSVVSRVKPTAHYLAYQNSSRSGGGKQRERECITVVGCNNNIFFFKTHTKNHKQIEEEEEWRYFPQSNIAYSGLVAGYRLRSDTKGLRK